MKMLLVVLLLAISTDSFAIPTKDTLIINSELRVGEQTIFPRLMILDGEKASVEIDSLHFELQPSLVGSNSVVIRAKVFRLIDGDKELISSPVIKAELGKRVSITTSSADGKRLEMNLKLIAHKSK